MRLKSLIIRIISAINGTYNSKIDTFIPNTLADLLIINYQVKYGKFIYNDGLKCSFEMINKSTMKVKIYRNNILEFATQIKGKLKDNFFYMESQKYKGKSIGLFLNLPEKKKTRIAILHDSNLAVDSKTRFGSRYFLIPMYYEDEEFNHITFNRIK
ncbi:MAG: hypothetical protein DWP98_12440 [Bacteroidetes bacterium]|nr:MAG: hypothetical protein DWP98_12440 [Bacteroidota bacterium]MBL1145008.1 hypothetical protein [Bacteroidota bacterium]NOG57805.1 hypothetical protein [Bacteroidota bacterium]